MSARRRSWFSAGSFCIWALCAWVLTAAPVWAIDVPRVQAELAGALDPLIAEHRGQVAVIVRHLDSGAEFAVRPNEPMPTASLIKLPILMTAYQMSVDGKLDLSEPLTLTDEDRAPGSGVLGNHFTTGTVLSVRDCLRLMIAYSDNTATNMVLRKIGIATVNRRLSGWECPHTRLFAFVYRPETSISPEDSQKWGLGKTSARDMLKLLEMLERKQVGSDEVSRQMLEHLAAAEDRRRLGQLIPENPRIALKTGAINASRNVAGIIYAPSGPIAICVLTKDNQDRSWGDDNAAHRLANEIARVAWKVFHPTAIGSPVSVNSGKLKLGVRGELVSDLQRTLNLRLEPSPKLNVDGEFGMQTELALRAFQKQAGLTVSGGTDDATWKALGPIPLSDETREKISSLPPRIPPATLDRPPEVTGKSWVVGNPQTGKIVAGGDADTPRDFASTTKVMTAYVTLQMAQNHPEWLDEVVTFSPRAAATPGSSAGIRAGEGCKVKELLLGLMLPSGNDAATALAEHMGAHLDPVNAAAPEPAYERFITEMNRVARSLKMSNTTYANPHGLTHADHRSTAADQFRLACAALKLPRFRQLIKTRSHVAVLNGPDGYQREVAWLNTNQLLNQEGYSGIKTGTTVAAGACLITLATHGNEEAVVVILGATSSDSRYIDTRNLLQWHWRKQHPQPAGS